MGYSKWIIAGKIGKIIHKDEFLHGKAMIISKKSRFLQL